MNYKESIRFALQEEMESLGFRHLKSRQMFRKIIDNNTTVQLTYILDRVNHGITSVDIRSGAEYRDIVLYNMQEISKIANGNQNLFLNLFELMVKQPIRNNPDMLYKKYWLNH